MYRLWQGVVWLGIFGFIVLLCFPNLLCLRSQIWKRVTFALYVRISAMQIIGSFQIVTDVTSIRFTFLGCIALFDFIVLFGFTFTFALFVRMRWGFRSCGSDHGLCPLDSHKPLKRLDRNFKCFCAVTFVWLIGLCAMLRPRRLTIPRFTANLMPPP